MNGPDYFTCERFRCRMQKIKCAKRVRKIESADAAGRNQTRRNAVLGGERAEIPDECRGCEQGMMISEEVGNMERKKGSAETRPSGADEEQAKTPAAEDKTPPEHSKQPEAPVAKRRNIKMAPCSNCTRTKKVIKDLCAGCYCAQQREQTPEGKAEALRKIREKRQVREYALDVKQPPPDKAQTSTASSWPAFTLPSTPGGLGLGYKNLSYPAVASPTINIPEKNTSCIILSDQELKVVMAMRAGTLAILE